MDSKEIDALRALAERAKAIDVDCWFLPEWLKPSITLAADREFIAAASPAVILSLLSDRDRLLSEIERKDAALRVIAARDFNCAPHQHGMAAQGVAEAALAPVSA